MKPFLTSNDGTNYAFGGAQTGTTDINPFDPSSPIHIDLPDQINAYDLLNPVPVKGALYTLDIGANDIMNALGEFHGGKNSLPEDRTDVSQAETNTIDSVGTLFGLGARSLLFYEVPNLGLTPRFDGTALQSLASDLAESFNVAVLKGLAPIESSGLKVFTLDTYDLLGEIKADLVRVRLQQCEQSVLDRQFSPILPQAPFAQPAAPDDQNKFLFWDEVHPTAARSHLLAAQNSPSTR